MSVLNAGRSARLGIWAGTLLAVTLATGATAAETAIKFSLDFKFEGPSAPFLLPLDKGYYKAEGVNVTIDSAAGSLEPINRVASGTYDMGFGDINSLIKFRDANPAHADQGGVHGLQPAAVLHRRPQEPRHQPSRRIWKARNLARPRPTAPMRSGRSSCRPTASMHPR